MAARGKSVCVLEAKRTVSEASWAGAGILHPIHPWRYPDALQPLLRAAPHFHERAAQDLARDTGIDVEWRRTGLLLMGDALEQLATWCGSLIVHETVRARSQEPLLRVDGEALWLPDATQVKSHRLAEAYFARARAAGVVVRENCPATAIEPGWVHTAGGRVRAAQTVLCAGAWSSRLAPRVAVEPVRGQILLYRKALRRMVVFSDGAYAVPRRDGHVLFGSTLEHVGFDGRPTEPACRDLEARAALFLGVEAQNLVAAWAGLRPGTESRLPYLGQDLEREDLFHAHGHYRNGILLAPITSEILADLVTGHAPEFDVSELPR